MKTAGWICLGIGVVSFLGAALKSNSTFGPLFWIGLGVFLLYKVNTKVQEVKKTPKESLKTQKEKPQTQECFISPIADVNLNINNHSNQQLESIEDIQAQLTLQQREAAICLISFFGGYNDNLMDNAAILIFKHSALFFGLPDSPSALSRIMSKYSDADMLIDIVSTIKPIKAKEFLLLTCYDLIKTSRKSEAYDLLYNIASDMGYDRNRLTNLIQLYQ